MKAHSTFGRTSLLLAALSLLAQTTAASAEETASPEWRSYIEPAIQAGEKLKSESRTQDPQALLELYRQYYSGLSMAYMGMFLGDAEHPDFWPFVHQAYNFLAPNPDDTYYLAPLDGKGSYRISGFRGTVHMVDMQIGSGTFFTHGDMQLGPNLATHDLKELHFGKDGSFDVILSAERPKGYKGDWWQLGEKATYILIRQVSYDWLRETDGRYAIERLDRPTIRPRQTANQIAEDLKNIPTWAENWTRAGVKWVGSYQAKGLVNKVYVHSLADVGGVSSQQYIEGQFEVGADEALIYETEIPKQCRYWNIQLTDMLWAALDWTNRQTSLNGYSARLDKDGKFRAVISATDPGVPNWLDSAGYETGAMVGRWTQCSSYPVPIITRVKLAELRKHLPADTPTVSAEQRDTSLRLRRKAAQLRRRW